MPPIDELAHLPLSRRAPSLVGSIIDSSTSLLAQQTHDIVRFAMGAPSDDLIPIAQFDRLSQAPIPSKYSYSATEGEPRLIAQTIEMLGRHGVTLPPERLLITTGGMQGLDLGFKLFVDPGDLVIVEAPTYTNGSATALSYGAELLEAPTDEHGLVVDALPELVHRAGRTPKAIYVIPTFQNPTGSTLTLARRIRLLELAEGWNSVIIDDDPYGLLRFAGPEIPTFSQIAGDNRLVFSVRTYSKIVAPGLRLGWVEADPALQQLLINAKQAMDTCTSGPTQLMVASFLEEGLLEPHLKRLRRLYRIRKDAMRSALATYFGDSVESTDPEGGFFLWLTFTGELAGLDTEQLSPSALEHGVAYIPGTAFSTGGSFTSSLRLCFATSSPERIDEGVRRLRRAVDHVVAAGHLTGRQPATPRPASS